MYISSTNGYVVLQLLHYLAFSCGPRFSGTGSHSLLLCKSPHQYHGNKEAVDWEQQQAELSGTKKSSIYLICRVRAETHVTCSITYFCVLLFLCVPLRSSRFPLLFSFPHISVHFTSWPMSPFRLA